MDVLLWIVVPYVCLATFVVGHIWRYGTGKLTFTPRSERQPSPPGRRLGVVLFHVGLLSVIGGHVLGILVPKSVTEAAGVPERLYHLVSVSMGTAAGAVTIVGFVILMSRRLRGGLARHPTTRLEALTFALLAIVLTTGMCATVGVNLLGGGYDYRETVAPWFRGIFMLTPHVGETAHAPLIYQIHPMCVMALLALWPFSPLVHAASGTLHYLRRAIANCRRGAKPTPMPHIAPRSGSSVRGDGVTDAEPLRDAT